MKTYIVNNLLVKGLDEDIQFNSAYLYVHKVGSVSWSLEIKETEQSEFFEDAALANEHLSITFSAEYMKSLKGNVMVKRVINNFVELKGSGELLGFND
ncbi:hypothetical protein [Bacillus cereus group sp. IBL03679]|uniref:hypothetical protein n=1 Tax=Bacillus cereus group sp. IBL03679 TaxID=3240095 RepID=UPI003D2F8851